MPNWCVCELVISTETQKGKEQLDKIQSKLEQDATDGIKLLQSLFPMPKELDAESCRFIDGDLTPEEKVLVEKFGYPNWYEWRIANWGTKWDVSDAEMERVSDLELVFSNCNFAWSYPDNWALVVSKKYPELKFSFLEIKEEGGFFAGHIVYQGGEVIEDGIYEPTAEEHAELWGYELEEEDTE